MLWRRNTRRHVPPKSIFAELQVGDRTKAVMVALQRGLIEMDFWVSGDWRYRVKCARGASLLALFTPRAVAVAQVLSVHFQVKVSSARDWLSLVRLELAALLQEFVRDIVADHEHSQDDLVSLADYFELRRMVFVFHCSHLFSLE
jgi:hypothetical protein